MDWNKLLNTERMYSSQSSGDDLRRAYVKDVDRILFSSAFRRLANKTQVHPLYENDHVHNRLTHSLEVTAVGRSLGYHVGSWLAHDHRAIATDQIATIAGLVQAACLAHDIGNPPFGHSGENAIGSWFKGKFSNSMQSSVLGKLTCDEETEFEEFEGNAQGFRILTRIETHLECGGLRLTNGALGAFTKYPTTAPVSVLPSAKKGASIGLKKYGIFLNDIATYERVASELGLKKEPIKLDNLSYFYWKRHPLAFLMEAADDICYNIMDIEDAYLAGDLEERSVIKLLEPFVKSTSTPKKVAHYRAEAIETAISSCTEAFKINYDRIMNGTFNSSLIEVSDKWDHFEKIEKETTSQIFTAKRKTELEVYGRNVIHNILNGMLPLLNDLQENSWDDDKLSSYNKQLARALSFPTKNISSSYEAVHRLTDFVSGMTDRYAVKVSKMLDGA